MRILVTGGCGFLGSHFVRARLREHADDIIINADCLTYAGSLENLEEADGNPRHQHHTLDICDAAGLSALWVDPFDLVVHFAAESHVDRSLEDAGRFVRTNVLGTQTLLAAGERQRDATIIIVSSDEVYGPTPNGVVFDADTPLCPTSPYAASKAAADWMALSYAHSFGLDLTIVRSVNVCGPRQYPEKLVPLFTTKALSGKPLPLYGDGLQQRSWLYVDDFVAGLSAIISDPETRRRRRVWHLGSDTLVTNRQVAEDICRLCGADPALITSVADRPGHDRRYALDWAGTKSAFGWQPQTNYAVGIEQAVAWNTANLDWCRVRTGWTPAFLHER